MRLVFALPDGRTMAVDAPAGARLLDVAQAAGMPLEGTCNGFMACGTCHVMLDERVLALIPPAGAEEEDMLDLLPDATRRSRLACQVTVGPALDGVTVAVVPG